MRRRRALLACSRRDVAALSNCFSLVRRLRKRGRDPPIAAIPIGTKLESSPAIAVDKLGGRSRNVVGLSGRGENRKVAMTSGASHPRNVEFSHVHPGSNDAGALTAAKSRLKGEGWCILPGVLDLEGAGRVLDRLWAAAAESERRGVATYMPVL